VDTPVLEGGEGSGSGSGSGSGAGSSDAAAPPQAEENTLLDLQEKYGEDKPPETVPVIQNLDNEPVVTRLTFNDIDRVLNGDDKVEEVVAPKSIERLEEISTARAIQRKLEEEELDEDRIQIHTDSIDLSSLGIMDLSAGDGSKEDLLGDIMVL
jgi:hypothetical protein